MKPDAAFLIVDDDPIFLAVAESAVEMLGFERVATAEDGARGLQALEASPHPIDFIILDLNMPGLDGLAFLRGAASLGFKGNVIISSGEAEAVLRSARLMGEMLGVTVVGALKKPLSVAMLQAVLTAEPEARRSAAQTPMRFTPECSLASLELVPYYQAQHSVKTREIIGLEALIRARAPDGVIHGPGRIFGMIHGQDELTATTLAIARKVIEDMRSWQEAGLLCRTSINLDAKVAEDPATGTALLSLAKEFGVEPGFISAQSEPIARKFAENAVAMAAELGLEVVAEGVETESQFLLAEACGAGAVQGFLLSKPIPASDTLRMLRQSLPQRLSA